MKTISHTLDRQQLYEKVWSVPIMHLAKEYGLSDVGLAKICKKHSIPRPPVGYWQKVKAGRRVRQPALPPSTEPDTIVITGYIIEEGDVPLQTVDLSIFDDIQPLLDAETRLENKIKVPRSLVFPNPLVARTMEDLKKDIWKDGFGRTNRRGTGMLEVRVGKGSIDRAMRILNALLKALTARGYSVTVEKPAHSSQISQIRILDEAVTFRIEEKIRRRSYDAARDEKRYSLHIGVLDSPPAYVFELNGKLILRLTNAPSGYQIQTEFMDQDEQPLEERLNAFILNAIKAGVAIKHERGLRLEAEAKRDAQRRQEQERLHQERMERERIERLEREERERIELLKRQAQERLDRLIRQAEDSRRSKNIRSFIEEVRAKWIALHGEIEQDSEVARWIAWAEQQSEAINPLTQKWPWE